MVMELTNSKEPKFAKMKNVQQTAAQLELSSVPERRKRSLQPYIAYDCHHNNSHHNFSPR